MINPFIIKATIAVAFIFTTSSLLAQDNELENSPFEVFKDYKRLGLNLSPRLHFKAKVNREYGAKDYKQKNGFGGGFGLDYVIRPGHRWSFRTGLHLNILLFNKSKIQVDEIDLPSNFSINEVLYNTSSLIFSIPAEVEYKHPLKDNIFLSMRGGVNFMFLQEGSFGISYSTLGEDNLSIPFFELEALSPDRKIYPNVKLSPGVYFIYDTFMLQTSFVYQKNIPNVLEGNYQFFNLEQSEPSGGSYSISGDYIGLEFVFFLKKSRKK